MWAVMIDNGVTKEIWPGGVVSECKETALILMRVARENVVNPSGGMCKAYLMRLTYCV